MAYAIGHKVFVTYQQLLNTVILIKTYIQSNTFKKSLSKDVYILEFEKNILIPLP